MGEACSGACAKKMLWAGVELGCPGVIAGRRDWQEEARGLAWRLRPSDEDTLVKVSFCGAQ